MNLLETLQNAFPGLRAHAVGDDYTLEVSAPSLHDVLQLLKRDIGFIFLLDIIAIDQHKLENGSERFAVIYHLLHMEHHRRLRVRVMVGESLSLPSIVDIWKSAAWSEREVHEMFGLKFDGHETKRLLTSSDWDGHPLLKDWQPRSLSERADVSNIDLDFPWLAHISDDERLHRHSIDIVPSHPGIQGSCLIRAEVLGDMVKRAKVEVGLQHRGVEKIAENKTFAQFMPYAERLNFSSPFIGAVAWAQTIEKASFIVLTDRAQAMRMIFMELARAMDHSMMLASMARDLGAAGYAEPFLRLRSIAQNLFLNYAGTRAMGPLVRIGGLHFDLPVGWIRFCLESVHQMQQILQQASESLVRNPAWLTLQGQASMSADQALDWGFTGPCLRACGVNYDLRKNSPYYFYADVDFDIPLGINGDPYDRYLVRVEEIRQSLRIISQILDHIPSGAIIGGDVDYETLKIAKGEYYNYIESSNGELGFYFVSDGSDKPYRLKIRAPSFFHFQSFTTFVENVTLDQATALLASMNAISAEIDR